MQNNTNNQSWNTEDELILLKMEENHRNPYKNNENNNINNNNPIIYLSIVIILLICVIIAQNSKINQSEIQNSNYYTENYTKNEKSEEITKKAFLPTVKTLSTGKYIVGTDIAAGLYNLEVESGTGLLTGDLKDGYLSEMMGIMEGYDEYYSETYKNLRLYNGDSLEITSGVSITFIPR